MENSNLFQIINEISVVLNRANLIKFVKKGNEPIKYHYNFPSEAQILPAFQKKKYSDIPLS